jgi:Ca2+/Na+ antiporter
VITERLDLPQDVAGATFLAVGSSAPELFANLADTFVYKNDIGSSTVVGSAVFNVLIGCGVGAYCYAPEATIPKYSVYRDGGFYALGIFIITLVFLDGEVRWYESLVLVSGGFHTRIL